MKPTPWLVAVLVGAVVGFAFAGLSTYDFVQHLDRQVHALHCSFIPGAGSSLGESGCQVAMMSEYSSVFRGKVWGGIPISLPAMAVFGFILCFAIDLLLSKRQRDPRATGFLALATALPAVTSLAMLIISLSQLGTTCKLCVGIYLASALCLVGAIVTWRRATAYAAAGGTAFDPHSPSAPRAPKPPKAKRRSPMEEQPDEPAWTSKPVTPRVLDEEPPADDVDDADESRPNRAHGGSGGPVSFGFLGAAFGIGVAFVVIPVIAYLALAPDHTRFVGTCEILPKPTDTYGIMVQIERGKANGIPSIEILDPLCPACRAFEERLGGSDLANRLDRKAVLFPLDNTCNWMVTEATHPGACTISEAVLCAKDRAPEVIAWAFAEQERIRNETKADPNAAARIVKERFPDLAACVGSADAKSRLNKSLRWAVANNIRVLTPQLFVGGVKLCDEDVDLGLESALGAMLDRYTAGTLAKPPAEAPPTTATPMGHGSDAPPATSTSDTKPSDTKPSDTKPADTKPSDTKPSDTKPSDTKPADTKPSDTKPSDTKPADTKPTDPSGPVTTPTDDKPADKPADPPKPADPKPADPKPADPAPGSGGTP